MEGGRSDSRQRLTPKVYPKTPKRKRTNKRGWINTHYITRVTTFASDHDFVVEEEAFIVRHRSPNEMEEACRISAVVTRAPPPPRARTIFPPIHNEDRATPDVRETCSSFRYPEMNVVCARGHKTFCSAARRTNVCSEHSGAYLLAEARLGRLSHMGWMGATSVLLICGSRGYYYAVYLHAKP